MSHNPKTRRDVMRSGALATLAIASAPALSAANLSPGTHGQLAVLVRRYFTEIAVSNATDHETDEKFDAHAGETYEKTMREMVGVPARTRDDALAALDWLIKDGADLSTLHQEDWNPLQRTARSLVYAVRDYIATREV